MLPLPALHPVVANSLYGIWALGPAEALTLVVKRVVNTLSGHGLNVPNMRPPVSVVRFLRLGPCVLEVVWMLIKLIT